MYNNANANYNETIKIDPQGENNNKSLIATLMEEVDKERNKHEKSLVATLMEEVDRERNKQGESSVKEESNNNAQDLISRIEQQIINAECQSGATDMKACMHEINEVNEAHESYLINAMNTNKTVSEVLYLGKFDKHNFSEQINESVDVREATEYVCMTETDSTEIHCVSTNDDNRIKFKSNREICLMPYEYAKIYLTSVDDDWKKENKEIILTSDGLLRDELIMDDNLNKLRGSTCETFVYNNSDKRLTLYAGQNICYGILLENPLVNMKSEAFCCFTSVEEDKLENEIGQLQFPQCRMELLTLLKEFRDVLAIKGDRMGKRDVVNHKIILEENAQPFYIPNYKLPIS